MSIKTGRNEMRAVVETQDANESDAGGYPVRLKSHFTDNELVHLAIGEDEVIVEAQKLIDALKGIAAGNS